jgi:hypothetical protein
MDWEHEGKPPKFDDLHDYQVWIYGKVRSVRRVGNSSLRLNPGTLAYTDCTNPIQNAICYEPDISAWRLKAQHDPAQTATPVKRSAASHPIYTPMRL